MLPIDECYARLWSNDNHIYHMTYSAGSQPGDVFEVESVVASDRTSTSLYCDDDWSRRDVWLYPTSSHVNFLSQSDLFSQFHFSVHYRSFFNPHLHLPTQLHFYFPHHNGAYGNTTQRDNDPEDGLDCARYRRVPAESSTRRPVGLQHDLRRLEHERALSPISLRSMPD